MLDRILKIEAALALAGLLLLGFLGLGYPRYYPPLERRGNQE